MRIAVTLAIAMLLAACGFQMRGAAPLPFETLHMPGTAGGIALDLKRSIQAGTRTTVVDDAKKAEAVLEFTQEAQLALDRQEIPADGWSGR